MKLKEDELPIDKLLDSLPPALRPIYETQSPNQSIQLYEGKLQITQKNKVSDEQLQENKLQGSGKVEYVWFPSPRIKFEFETVGRNNSIKLGNVLLTFSEHNTSENAYINNFVYLEDKLKISGNINNLIIEKNSQKLNYILFHVVNCHRFIGRTSAVLDLESNRRTLEREVLEVEEWKITLNELESTERNIDELKEQEGFAVTHIGRVEKIDGTTFSKDEAEELLEIFSNFLSFCRGFRVPIVLPVGYNENNHKILEQWKAKNGDSWQQVRSWFPDQEQKVLANGFPGFFRQWKEWKESANLILHCYLEANKKAGGEEGAIILIQTALELLSWLILVEKTNEVSRKKFDKQTRSNLEKLLSKANIPLNISLDYDDYNFRNIYKSATGFSHLKPQLFLQKLNDFLEEMKNLDEQQNNNNNNQYTYGSADGVYLLIKIRNDIIHPEKKTEIFKNPIAKWEAYNLGLWYLELILLYLFDYQGNYANRLIEARQNGLTDPVPWKEKSA